jgi:multiple sugar transport system permease protein
MTSDTRTAAEERQEPRRQRHRRGGMAKREARLGLALILPAVLVVGLLFIFPMLWNISLSFQKARLINIREVSLVGFDPTLQNYETVIGASDFWPVLRTTFVYTIFGTILSILMGLWAALTLQKAFRGRALVRGLVLFPYVVPVIAAAFVWKVMLNPQFGIVNVWIERLGGNPIDFLNTRNYDMSVLGLFTITIPLALITVIVFEAWRYFPFAFLFILAALIAQPKDVEEAAIVDGATISQRFWYVTLPALRPVISVLFLLRFIWTFNKFDDVFLLTGGAAGTEVITVKIFQWLTGRANVGAAAALGIVLALILLVLVAIYFRFFYEEEETA